MIYIVTPLSKKLQQLTLTGFSKALFSPIAASNSIGNHILLLFTVTVSEQ